MCVCCCYNSLKLSVKPNKASQLEDEVKGFARKLGTPVPRAGQPAINAAASVVKVIGARPIKRRREKVVQDILPEFVNATVASLHHLINAFILFANALQILKACHNWAKYPRH